VAEKLNIEQPPQGQAGTQEQAAAVAAQPQAPIIPEPMGEAIVASVAQAEQQKETDNPSEPKVIPPPPIEPGLQQPQEFQGVRGIMQAPAVMRQPVRTRFERDQQVQMMWDVVARNQGSALTQTINSALSGVD
jgi:hypothetical protein